jgi:hypothetical protein
MKATIKIKTEVEIKTLQVDAGVRYWEDATVNGVEDEDGSLIPCKEDERWCPLIDIETGIITNWAKGVKADIHYKICDDGNYFLKDENGNTILSIKQDYVPEILDLYHESYGDYIIMQIDENGKIDRWKSNPDIKDFQDEDED